MEKTDGGNMEALRRSGHLICPVYPQPKHTEVIVREKDTLLFLNLPDPERLYKALLGHTWILNVVLML